MFVSDHSDVVLADFGGAYRLHECAQGKNIQSREYRAPEILIQAPWSEKIDVWSLGAIVYEVATRAVLLPPNWVEKHEKDMTHLTQISELFGPFPSKFALSGLKSRDFFDEAGKLRAPIRRRSLAAELKEKHNIDDPDLVEFVTACLTIDPRFRPSAEDLQTFRFAQ